MDGRSAITPTKKGGARARDREMNTDKEIQKRRIMKFKPFPKCPFFVTHFSKCTKIPTILGTQNLSKCQTQQTLHKKKKTNICTPPTPQRMCDTSNVLIGLKQETIFCEFLWLCPHLISISTSTSTSTGLRIGTRDLRLVSGVGCRMSSISDTGVLLRDMYFHFSPVGRLRAGRVFQFFRVPGT